ncbi:MULTISPECIES: hypothetical protein [Streptomyces]|uniref:Uncharacterized protein n=2 Tax=Streptomyces TaxID=1883 RepID=A0A1D8G3W0_9ACTN|nr:hypothetical protein A4G23_02977 [Streptomyces rubrolavendulae]KAF0650904.1 hypothetical protein K701_05875 [Streptomyces fradiae ATCC 10745 = DSM 40063]OSY53728.1 hypothetical protein BG846_00598 [Streptomyces fradiae ATCC 10745 = DSM 40063]QEV15793.1 hypothetical protein CP974_16165 [Streptomyces fradiae ATCC 10745 = DSM 40063]UQS31479.1 hypothetical protein J5J01_07520 [Streptomyces fradiae]
MTRYRLQYAPPADLALDSMGAALRSRFDTGMRTWLVPDPYGYGSVPIGTDDDRREATVSGVVIRYYVSRGVSTVTVVRVVYV